MTVHFIGAGPGAPDLLTLRGRDLIAACPVCLYAGSLVPEGVLAHCPPDVQLVNTAPLSLDEIINAISAAHAQGHDVARLHSGDLSVWSAMGEQLRRLRAANIAYTVTPGVPSFAAAAASPSSTGSPSRWWSPGWPSPPSGSPPPAPGPAWPRPRPPASARPPRRHFCFPRPPRRAVVGGGGRRAGRRADTARHGAIGGADPYFRARLGHAGQRIAGALCRRRRSAGHSPVGTRLGARRSRVKPALMKKMW